MMPEKELCRRCLLRESGEEDKALEVKECISRIKESEKAADGIYAQRLSLCRECEHLLSGTCMKCGCYVELRAAFRNNHCPLAGTKRKW